MARYCNQIPFPMSSYPPPRKVAHIDEKWLPDYYLGRLIWEDTTSGDACRWVIYDGMTQQRFTTRAAAERWIREQPSRFPQTARERLERQCEVLTAVYQTLDQEAQNLPDLEQRVIENIALHVHKCEESLQSYLNIQKL